MYDDSSQNIKKEQIQCRCCDVRIENDNYYLCNCGYQMCWDCFDDFNEDKDPFCPQCDGELVSDSEEEQIPQTQTKTTSDSIQKPSPNKPNVTSTSVGCVSNGINYGELAKVRVIKKNLVYVIGLSPEIANEEMLTKKEYFSQYGKITKIVVNTSNAYNPKGPNGPSYSAYITFSSEREASMAILGTEEYQINERVIRASYGTTKYCSFFLKQQECPNLPDCLYLHSFGKDKEFFQKDESTSNKNIFIDQQKMAVKNIQKYVPELIKIRNTPINYSPILPSPQSVIERLVEQDFLDLKQKPVESVQSIIKIEEPKGEKRKKEDNAPLIDQWSIDFSTPTPTPKKDENCKRDSVDENSKRDSVDENCKRDSVSLRKPSHSQTSFSTDKDSATAVDIPNQTLGIPSPFDFSTQNMTETKHTFIEEDKTLVERRRNSENSGQSPPEITITGGKEENIVTVTDSSKQNQQTTNTPTESVQISVNQLKAPTKNISSNDFKTPSPIPQGTCQISSSQSSATTTTTTTKAQIINSQIYVSPPIQSIPTTTTTNLNEILTKVESKNEAVSSSAPTKLSNPQPVKNFTNSDTQVKMSSKPAISSAFDKQMNEDSKKEETNIASLKLQNKNIFTPPLPNQTFQSNSSHSRPFSNSQKSESTTTPIILGGPANGTKHVQSSSQNGGSFYEKKEYQKKEQIEVKSHYKHQYVPISQAQKSQQGQPQQSEQTRFTSSSFSAGPREYIKSTKKQEFNPIVCNKTPPPLMTDPKINNENVNQQQNSQQKQLTNTHVTNAQNVSPNSQQPQASEKGAVIGESVPKYTLQKVQKVEKKDTSDNLIMKKLIITSQKKNSNSRFEFAQKSDNIETSDDIDVIGHIFDGQYILLTKSQILKPKNSVKYTY